MQAPDDARPQRGAATNDTVAHADTERDVAHASHGDKSGIHTPGARAAYEALADSASVLARVAREWAVWVDKVASEVTHRLARGGQVLTCGNGGSAADAQHIVTELAGMFYLRDRRPLAAVALTTNTSVLTSVANDFSYDDVFARQVGSIGRPGDVLFALSTSGRARSVRRAVEEARRVGLWIVGFTGERGVDFAALCDTALIVPSSDVARIQESHIAVGHAICALVERAAADLPPSARALPG
jgi:D-sedoheptulose 7-phosphate isomerase